MHTTFKNRTNMVLILTRYIFLISVTGHFSSSHDQNPSLHPRVSSRARFASDWSKSESPSRRVRVKLNNIELHSKYFGTCFVLCATYKHPIWTRRMCRTGRPKALCRVRVFLVKADLTGARNICGKTPPKHAVEPRDCPCRPRAPRRVGV